LSHEYFKKRKLCKRRAVIEPIIGHLKSDFRLSRNLLKGQVGDEINVLMAACAWNLKKWLVIATIFLFWQKLGLFFVKYLRFFAVLDKNIVMTNTVFTTDLLNELITNGNLVLE
jgi:hypothetical protein